MPRPDGRARTALRPLKFTRHAPGSVLTRMGNTVVLCTRTVEDKVPDFLVGKGRLTAKYGMLPGSTHSRKPRRHDHRRSPRRTPLH